MILEPGQILMYEGTVTDNEDPQDLGRCTIQCPERFGTPPVRFISPLLPPYLEIPPRVKDPVRVVELPGGAMYYLTLALDGVRDRDNLLTWTPLKAILLALFGIADQFLTHTHLAGTKLIAPAGGGACTGFSGGPMKDDGVTPLDDYGDGRSDTEGNEPMHPWAKLITEGPGDGS